MSRVAALLGLLYSAQAVALTPSQKAAAWLETKQGTDGSFGGATGTEPIVTSLEAIQALTPVLGATSTPVDAARVYLRVQSPFEFDLQARRLIALDGTSLADPLAAGFFRSGALTQGYGFLGDDSVPSALDSVQAIAFLAQDAMAASLITARIPTLPMQGIAGCTMTSTICPAVGAYVTYLVGLENSGGGWSYAGENSDVRLTAEILSVLMPLRAQLSIDSALDNASKFLVAAQATDGHFGTSTPPTADTALAMVSILGAPTSQTAAVSKALTYLSGQQLTDGSWDDSELNTALAVRGVRAALPNLHVDQAASGFAGSLSLSTHYASPGTSITATLTVSNTGASASVATAVSFTAVGETGQPAVSVGSATVPIIAAGASAPVVATLTTTALHGAYSVVAVVDPTNLVDESNESDNQTSDQVTISTALDLAISTTDIQFTPSAGQVQISVTVHEDGAAVNTPFQVAIYRGDPQSGGVLLGTQSITSIAEASSASVSLLWNPSKASGGCSIFAVADSTNAIVDANRQNNTASRLFFGAVFPTDLQIRTADLVVAPIPVYANQLLQITATVHNLSAYDANRVQVALCRGAFPTTCDDVVGLIDSVPANGSASTTLTMPGLPQGPNYITASVDPFGQLNDPNLSNNVTDIQINVQYPAYDFSIISFTGNLTGNGLAQAGNPISLVASLQNNTADQTGVIHVPYALYSSAPEEGGQELQSGTVEIQPGGSVTPTGLTLTAQATGARTTFVLVLDPTNTLPDANRSDNRASVTVGANADTTDLGLFFNDISFKPVGPFIGESTTVTATVHNYGTQNATTNLRVFEGDPSLDGTKVIGLFPLAVTASSTATVSFKWTRGGMETNLFFALVDTVPTDSQYLNDKAQRNAFVEAIYDSGRRFIGYTYSPSQVAYEPGPYVSFPAVGDILQTGQPVIAYGDNAAPNATQALHYTSVGFLELVQKKADNSLSLVWSRQAGEAVGSPVFVDLGVDGGPMIVFESEDGQWVDMPNSYSNTIHVWRPDSGIFWEKTFAPSDPTSSADLCMIGADLGQPGVGDVNGDGIADIVFAMWDTVYCLNGKDGTTLWSTKLNGSDYCYQSTSPTPPFIGDINGDGKNEVVFPAHQSVHVFGSTGVDLADAGLLSSSPGGSQSFAALLDAGPNLYSVSGPLTAYALATGKSSWSYQDANTEGWADLHSPAVMDGLQRGLPSIIEGAYNGMESVGPDGLLQWSGIVTSTANPAYYQAGGGVMGATDVVGADLLGLGRPQLIGTGFANQAFMLDSRNGQTLWGPAVIQDSDTTFIAVADVDGDGHGEVVATNDAYAALSGVQIVSSYKSASLVIYGSDNHWAAMPTVWSGANYHHDIGSNLKITADAYKPWTTHDTWREQFVTTPVTIMPDLAVGRTGSVSDIVATYAPDAGAIASGSSAAVAVTVHNLGGVAASNVPVNLYDGDPDAGGVLIGTTKITGPIAVRVGTGVASFTWTAWPEGADQLYAVVNPPYSDGGRAITESGYENNETNTTVLVGPGTNLADLSVQGADFGNTLGYIAGQPVTVQITVSNNGNVAAGAFNVLVTDGAGGTGPVLGNIPVSGLGVGKSTLVQVMNWIPAQGPHVVTINVDPPHLVPDSNLGNNVAEVFMTIGQAVLPDLAVTASDLNLAPAGAVLAGTQVQLSSTIHNYGTPIGNIPVVLSIDGTQLVSSVISGTMESGASLVLVSTIDTSKLTGGAHTVKVQIDPNGTIREYDKSNDTAQITLTVDGVQANVTVTTDLASYPASSPSTVTVALASVSTTDANYLFSVSIQTPTGAVVHSLANAWSEALGSGLTQTFTYPWNTGLNLSGNYLAVATLTDPASGIIVASGQASFSITGTVSTSVVTAPMLTGYAPGSTAVVASTVINASPNAALTGFNLTVTVKTPTGGAFFSSTRQNLTLLNELDERYLDAITIAPASASGAYPITATVTDSSNHQLATGSGTLTVQAATLGTELGGTLTATPYAFAPGTNVSLAAALTNLTGGVIQSQPVVIEVTNPTLQTVVQTTSSNQWWDAGQTVNVTDNYATTSTLPLGNYLAAVLVNSVPIAHAILNCDDGGTVPPLITVTGVSDGELTNQLVTPVITFSAPSGGPVTDTITLNGTTFVSGTQVTAAGTYFLVVNATDAKSNTASVTVVFTLYKTLPTITIGGITNNQYTNAASVTPTVRITDPYLDQTKTTMTLNGTAFALGTHITAEGTDTFVVKATDKAANAATSTTVFTIDRTAPTVTVTGVSNGQYSNAASLTPVITVTDTNLDSTKTVITLNGSAFTSGTAVTAEGDYTLVAKGQDKAGNTATVTDVFHIDRTAPVIAVTGVTNNATYRGPVNPVVIVTELHPSTTTITLDTITFVSGTVVTASGAHSLVVTSTDKANNQTTSTTAFTITPAYAAPKLSPGVCTGTITLADSSLIAPQVDGGQPFLLNTYGALSGVSNVIVEGGGTVQGNVTWSGNANLTGKLILGGTETLTAPALIGSVTKDAGLLAPCCVFDAGAALIAAAANNDNARLPAGITQYVVDGGFAISSASVAFPSGAFYFTTFSVTKTGQVTVTTGDKVWLYVNGALTVQDQGVFTGDPAAIDSLVVVAGGNISLTAGSVSTTIGGITVIASYLTSGLFYSGGGMTLGESTEVIGALGATSLNMSQSASVIVPNAYVPSSGQVTCQ